MNHRCKPLASDFFSSLLVLGIDSDALFDILPAGDRLAALLRHSPNGSFRLAA
jgi:hypothetical protein